MLGLKESMHATLVGLIGVVLKNLASRFSINSSRVRECCGTCNAERSRRAARSYKSRLLRWLELQKHKEDKVDDTVGFHPCNRQLVITVNAPPDFQLSLDFLPCFQGFANDGWILGSEKGLLLCSSRKMYPRERCATQYYLCDPVSKHWIALPPTPKSTSLDYLGFVFDPCPNFGNPDLHQPLPCIKACRFKVLRLRIPETSSTNFEAEIFSSDVGQWTTASLAPISEASNQVGSLFHNGCLYLLRGQHLVVIDPYNNKLHGLIPTPPRSQLCDTSFLEGPKLCRGSIWLFQLSCSSLYLRSWELIGCDLGTNGKLDLDKCYWRPYRLCDLTEIIDDSCCPTLLAMHPHDPDVVYFPTYDDPSHIVSCNLRTKVMSQTMIGYDGLQDDQITIVFPPISDPVSAASPEQ